MNNQEKEAAKILKDNDFYVFFINQETILVTMLHTRN